MSKGQKRAITITLIVLLPLTISLFYLKISGTPSLYLYFKAALSVGFVFCSLITVYLRKNPDILSLLSIFALILGMLGDIFINLANKIEGIGYVPGVLLFMLQHIMMCTGLLICGRSSGKRKRLFIIMPVTAAGICLFIFVLVTVAGAALNGVVIPIIIYGTILAWTAVIPFAIRGKKDTRLLMLGIAGIAFFAADSLLVCGLIDNIPVIISAANIIPYYYAQYFIAFSTGLADRKT